MRKALSVALIICVVLLGLASFAVTTQDQQAPAHVHHQQALVAAGCKNTDLGNGWTCIQGTDYYAADGFIEELYLKAAPIAAGDLLVFCMDDAATGLTSASYKVTDTAGNAWTQWAPSKTTNLPYQSIDQPNGGYSCWYVLNSKAHAVGYEVIINGGIHRTADLAIGQFRYTYGASRGIEANIAYDGSTLANQGDAADGKCPCAAGNQTITTAYSGDLIIGMANMSAGPDWISSGLTVVDSSTQCVPKATEFCFFVAKTQAAAGIVGWSWSDTNASDPYFSALMAFRNSNW
jgi:hypothetical protein